MSYLPQGFRSLNVALGESMRGGDDSLIYASKPVMEYYQGLGSAPSASSIEEVVNRMFGNKLSQALEEEVNYQVDPQGNVAAWQGLGDLTIIKPKSHELLVTNKLLNKGQALNFKMGQAQPYGENITVVPFVDQQGQPAGAIFTNNLNGNTYIKYGSAPAIEENWDESGFTKVDTFENALVPAPAEGTVAVPEPSGGTAEDSMKEVLTTVLPGATVLGGVIGGLITGTQTKPKPALPGTVTDVVVEPIVKDVVQTAQKQLEQELTKVKEQLQTEDKLDQYEKQSMKNYKKAMGEVDRVYLPNPVLHMSGFEPDIDVADQQFRYFYGSGYIDPDLI